MISCRQARSKGSSGPCPGSPGVGTSVDLCRRIGRYHSVAILRHRIRQAAYRTSLEVVRLESSLRDPSRAQGILCHEHVYQLFGLFEILQPAGLHRAGLQYRSDGHVCTRLGPGAVGTPGQAIRSGTKRWLGQRSVRWRSSSLDSHAVRPDVPLATWRCRSRRCRISSGIYKSATNVAWAGVMECSRALLYRFRGQGRLGQIIPA